MASIILASMGASVGNAVLPGLGGKLLGAFARKVGHVIDGEIGWSSRDVPKDGPRLENFKVQDSRYGVKIPQVFGRVRVAGNVIWASDLIETAHTQTVSGGKGGVVSSAFSSTRTTYTYSLNCAIALCEGTIGGIQTIWADSKVIYQNGVWKSGVVASWSFHDGAQDQTVDPLLESWCGSGLCPSYRGVAYVVLQGLELKSFGNRLPNLTFEVLPARQTGTPRWLGHLGPSIIQNSFTLRHGGMRPITTDGGAVSARRMIFGGHQTDGAYGNFEVITYDVTDDKPVELARHQSTSFVCEDVGDESWALAPDGRMVAMGLQDNSTGQPYHLALYDSANGTFGPVLSVPMNAAQIRQMAWIDALHVVIPATSGGQAGVRVFARAGSGLVDLGFYGVWGEGSASERVPVGYTTFVPFGDGLLMFMGDSALKFGGLYACYLSYGSSGLSTGSPFCVASAVDLGNGSGPQVALRQTAENEWTLFYMTAIDMRMMSFVANKTGATITRPWQTITSTKFVSSYSNAPLVVGDKVVTLHRAVNETMLRISEIALDDGVFTVMTDAIPVDGFVSPSTAINAELVDPLKILVFGNVGFESLVGMIGALKRRNTGDTLDAVVGSVLLDAGYKEEDFDLSALSGVDVDGYSLTDQATAAGALEPLKFLQPFDLVETDGKLKAVLLGEGATVSVPSSEGRATLAVSDDPPPRLTMSRAQEIDLPVELSIDYLDATRDYEVSSQRARRTASKGARSQAKVEMPVVCSPSRAKKIAEQRLFLAWLQRDSYRLLLSRKYAALDPADTLLFDDIKMRIASVVLKDGLLQVDGVRAPPSGFVSAAQAEHAYTGNGGGSLGLQQTSFALMDGPLLRAEDDQPGYYVAASGLQGWSGATLWRADDGVGFSPVASLSASATMGIAVSALPQRVPEIMDRVSTVRVQLLRGTLASCTQQELLDGANAAMLGQEVIQFQTATLVADGLYELSNLLRGRLGTEACVATHALGERFTMLGAGVSFVPAALSDRTKTTHLRAVTNGGSLDYAQDVPFTIGLKVLEPLAPVHLRCVRSGATGADVVFSWVRRARKNAPWVDYIDVPLDEDAERYDVEIMNGTSVARTFSALTTNSVLYSAAQQSADWGALVPTSFLVRVYQTSARYGRGKALVAVV